MLLGWRRRARAPQHQIYREEVAALGVRAGEGCSAAALGGEPISHALPEVEEGAPLPASHALPAPESSLLASRSTWGGAPLLDPHREATPIGGDGNPAHPPGGQAAGRGGQALCVPIHRKRGERGVRGGTPTREEGRGHRHKEGRTDGMGKDERGQFCGRGGGVGVGLREGGGVRMLD